MRVFLMLFCWMTASLAVVNYFSDDRLPTTIYFLIVVVQSLVIVLQLVWGSYMTCVFGFSLTLVLAFAVMIEWTPYPAFDLVLSVDVYLPEVIGPAYGVLLLTTSLYHALTLQFVTRYSWRWPPASAADRIFALGLLRVGMVLTPLIMVLNARGSLITTAGYASVEAREGASRFYSSGLELIGTLLLVAVLVAARRLYRINDRRFLAVVMFCSLLVFYFRLMRGDRAGSLIFFTTIGILYFQGSVRPTWQKLAVVTAGLAALFVFYEVWGYVRWAAHDHGLWDSVISGFQYEVLGDFTELEGFDPLKITLLPASYWHLLHTVDLYELGVRLDGSSFVNLIPQMVPLFLAEAIGFERPEAVPWLLGEYRLHLGGMFVIGEGYWNLGLFGAALVAIWMACVVMAFEKWCRKREPLLVSTYFGYTGTVGFSVYYGLQAQLRAVEITAAVAVVLYLGIKKHRRIYARRVEGRGARRA